MQLSVIYTAKPLVFGKKKATALSLLAQIKNQQISCFVEEMILHHIIRIYP